MIEELRKNVDSEIEILRELAGYVGKREGSMEEDKKLLDGAIVSLTNSLKVINNSIPDIIKEIQVARPLPRGEKKVDVLQNLKKVSFQRDGGNVSVVLNSRDKEKFLKDLSISENFVRRIKKREKEDIEKYEEFKAARGYLKMSNRFFLESAGKLIQKGYFKQLSVNLQKGNIDILFGAYVAMMLFSSLLSVVAGFVLSVFFLFFNLGFSWPFISVYSGEYLIRILQVFWIPFVLPVLTFFILYYYPSSEKNSLEKKIEQELPFAVIHMSAISGSGIEPSEIFRIIGLSKDYPGLRREIRKVINQINLYGYDLVTALNNASKSAPSEKLAELFAGLSTTITTGASLPEFFSKRAESLLMSYRLDRERYTKIAETFMDIYISVVIAAPMILLLLLIIISVSGVQQGLSSSDLGIGVVIIVALLNLFFLGFLQMKQPTY